MSEVIKVEVDTSDAKRELAVLKNDIEDTEDKIVKVSKDVSRASKNSFNEVMNMARASYMVISGVTQAMGGDLGQAFSAIYGIAMSAIGTASSIAAALAASGPAGWLQAGLMTSSLVTAMISLGAVSAGQTELSRSVSGINMALHGFGQSISSWGL